MSRYFKEFSNDDISDPILTLATGGLNLVTKIAVDALIPGKTSLKWFCKITDTKSGAYATGEGYSRGEASADAWFRLTGEKDNKYQQNEEERRRKKAEWELRQSEREKKQKEWELKRKEAELRKIEWEQRQKERDRKQKEWEIRKEKQEKKKLEWEQRQKERERKKAEWEQRQREREQKQREYELRQRESERKKAEWEQRQRERAQKQREYEQRQREREIKKAEWEARKAENERRRSDYLERQRNRSSRSSGRGGGGRSGSGNSGGGCYITSATCISLNKKDDCIELNAFRDFRDNWLVNQKNGKKLIKEYYLIAPKLVEIIETKINKNELYFEIWNYYLKTCFQMISQNKYIEAKETYISMVNNLKEKYL